ncbi:MAG: hypothetical protein ACI8PZ_003472 [Myxococcota bacterium]|jgi:hypothetical protein
MTLCDWMRSKSLGTRHFTSQADLEAALTSVDSPFSCLRTCQPWGPDGQLCAPGTCGEERTCFERSPRNPRPQPSTVG